MRTMSRAFAACWPRLSLPGASPALSWWAGVGVHQGLRFREELPPELPVTTAAAGGELADNEPVATGALAVAGVDDRRSGRRAGSGLLHAARHRLRPLWARAHDRRSVLMTESTAYDHVRRGWREWGEGFAAAGAV